MKTVKFLLNIGTADQHLLRLKEAYLEGQAADVGDTEAETLIRRGWARLYDQHEEDARLSREHEADIERAMPLAKAELAKEEAKQEALRRLKNAPKDPHDPKGPVPSPTILENAAEAAQKLDRGTDTRGKQPPPKS